MKKISDLFEIFSGSKLDFNKQIINNNGITFVSRDSNNNGVVGKVTLEEDMKTYKKGDITVTLGGSYLLSCFVQKEDFVTAQNVAVLRSKNPMTDLEKWFYCYALRQNRFKFFPFGREVNKYLADIEVPETIPSWVNDSNLKPFKTNINYSYLTLNTNDWKDFKIDNLFDIKRGNISNLEDLAEGDCPIVSAYGQNQGISFFANEEGEYENCLTASMNGSKTGYIAFHGYKFNANADCGILLPKFRINTYIGLFLVTIMRQESYKYFYGRKLSVNRLKNEIIKLPATIEGNPDWEFMEHYIKCLPNSDIL